MTRRTAILLVGLTCLALQVVSATVQTRSLVTPNTSTGYALGLVEEGRLSVEGLRAYHLPGEALYLAAGFVALPESAWRYLHVPVVVLFAVSIAAAGIAVAGPAVGAAAGLAASLDPFVLAHGPVWDDSFLAASLEWSVLALLLTGVVEAGSGPRGRGYRAAILLLAGAGAGAAALTRTTSQLALIGVAFATGWFRALRPARATGWAIAVGVAAALALWGGRNALVLGEFFIGSTHDGKTLYESNCAHTRRGIAEYGVVGGFIERCSERPVSEILAADGEIEVDRRFRDEALAYMREHPVDVARTAGFKLAVSLSGVDLAAPMWSIRNTVGVTSSLLVLALGTAGLWRLGRLARHRPPVACLLVAAAISAGVTVLMLGFGPVGLRYRLAFTGFMYVGIGVVAAGRGAPGAPVRRVR